MDIITHGLFGLSIFKSISNTQKVIMFSILFGALIPDIGEIFIQLALAKKYGATIAVYDERTSDAIVASNLKVTLVYDVLHSLILPTFLILCSFIVKLKRNVIQYVALGLYSHIFLDCFTHGKIWALKLFYPLVNQRFQIFSSSIGNWWEWKPQIKILSFNLPVICLFIWTILAIYIIYKKRK